MYIMLAYCLGVYKLKVYIAQIKIVFSDDNHVDIVDLTVLHCL